MSGVSRGHGTRFPLQGGARPVEIGPAVPFAEDAGLALMPARYDVLRHAIEMDARAAGCGASWQIISSLAPLTASNRVTRSCGGLKRKLPARKYENRGMALEGTGKNLSALNTEIHSTVFDSGNGGLRNTSEIGELTLAQLLEFAQDADRLADRNLNALLRRTIVFHIRTSGHRGR